MKNRYIPILFVPIMFLGACTSAQLAKFNGDVQNFTTAMNTDVQLVAVNGIPAVCSLATTLYTGYAATQAALSGQAAADFNTATKVYTALTTAPGLCAPNAPAPTNAVTALAELVAQVKAIQAALKPSV